MNKPEIGSIWIRTGTSDLTATCMNYLNQPVRIIEGSEGERPYFAVFYYYFQLGEDERFAKKELKSFYDHFKPINKLGHLLYLQRNYNEKTI